MQEIEHEVIFTRHVAEKSFLDDKSTGRAFVRSVQISGKDRDKREFVLELAGPNISSLDRKFTTVSKAMTTIEACDIASAVMYIMRKVEAWRAPLIPRAYTEFATDVSHSIRIGAGAKKEAVMSFFIEASDDGRTVRCQVGNMKDFQELMDVCTSVQRE